MINISISSTDIQSDAECFKKHPGHFGIVGTQVSQYFCILSLLFLHLNLNLFRSIYPPSV